MITKNLRNYIVVLKDSRQFDITEQQYQIYKMEQEDKKFNDSFIIQDIDTKEILFDGRWAEFKEFKQKKSQNMNGKYIICDFGLKHSLEEYQYGEGCQHSEEFGSISGMFKLKLREMGYIITHPKDVTDKMRYEYKSKFIN